MDDQAKIWDRLARRYVAAPISDPTSYERKLEMTRAYLGPDMEVLELGCGSGGTARRHAPLVKSYRATDLSEKMLEQARAQGPIPKNLSFEQGDIGQMVLAPESLDMILALSLLHLLRDPAGAIRKAHEALRPGGYFVTSTACVSGNAFFRLIVLIGQALRVIPYINFFRPDALRGMMCDAGFEIVEDWQPIRGKALFLIARKGR